ncbi:MAG: NBR1-Ig-like domain-containing protein, partial [candidate division WOR-3 bacterium]
TKLIFQKYVTLLICILLILILSGCNLGKSQEQSLSNKRYTEAAETVAVQLTAKATNRTQTIPTQTPPVSQNNASSTPVTLPTEAITSTTESQPEPTQSPTPTFVPCNWALFITDVTYPDNAEVPAGTDFVKTWRLQNIGSCSWDSNYKIAYHSGERMGSPEEQPISSESIPSGGIIDVSINLKSPSEPGTYQTYFILKASDGKYFGIGDNANGTFYVKIIVPIPSKTPTEAPTNTSTPTIEITNTPLITETPQP